MSFDQIRYYRAYCDIRLAFDADRLAVVVHPSDADWRAWSEAGSPKDGPLRDAVGVSCGASARADAFLPAGEARRKLQTDGWAFQHTRIGWRAACPDHREHLRGEQRRTRSVVTP